MATIINGKLIAKQILTEIKRDIQNLNINPTLAVIQIGNKIDSNVYIRKKREACKLIGIESKIYNLKTIVSTDEVCSLIKKLNDNKSVNGILVQLPIPDHLNKEMLIGLAIVNPVYFFCMMIGAMKNLSITIAVIGGTIFGPVIYLISTEWALLFAGLISGTIAFLFGVNNGK